MGKLTSSGDSDSNDDIKNHFEKRRLKRLQEKLARKRLDKIHRRYVKILREREKCGVNLVEPAETILESDLEKALTLLDDVPSQTCQKKKSVCEESVLKNISPSFITKQNNFWYLPTYIPHLVRNSILMQDWNKLTHLLLLLLENKPIYMPLVKQAAFINIFKNPSDSYGDVLEEFISTCFTAYKNDQVIQPYDVCFKDILSLE